MFDGLDYKPFVSCLSLSLLVFFSFSFCTHLHALASAVLSLFFLSLHTLSRSSPLTPIKYISIFSWLDDSTLDYIDQKWKSTMKTVSLPFRLFIFSEIKSSIEYGWKKFQEKSNINWIDTKRLVRKSNHSSRSLQNIFLLEIDMLKANTKFTEKGQVIFFRSFPI